MFQNPFRRRPKKPAPAPAEILPVAEEPEAEKTEVEAVLADIDAALAAARQVVPQTQRSGGCGCFSG